MPLGSPQSVFSGLQLNASRRYARVFLPGLEPGSGLLLTRNGCSPQSLHSGVTASGLPLPLHAAPFPGPFGFKLRYPDRFAPARAASSPETRCRFLRLAFGLVTCLHSPSGLLPPSGSKRSTRVVAEKPALPVTPGFPSLPAADSLVSSDYGSSFRVRYVSGGLLFPPSSPATSFLNLAKPFFASGTNFCVIKFSSFIILFFAKLY